MASFFSSGFSRRRLHTFPLCFVRQPDALVCMCITYLFTSLVFCGRRYTRYNLHQSKNKRKGERERTRRNNERKHQTISIAINLFKRFHWVFCLADYCMASNQSRWRTLTHTHTHQIIDDLPYRHIRSRHLIYAPVQRESLRPYNCRLAAKIFTSIVACHRPGNYMVRFANFMFFCVFL